MNIKFTNNKNFEINKKFYQTAKKTLRKIKKNLVPLNIIIMKEKGKPKFFLMRSEIINYDIQHHSPAVLDAFKW